METLKKSANGLYRHFAQINTIHNFSNGYALSGGSFELGVNEACFWFYHIICENQDFLSSFVFQNWTLKKVGGHEYLIVVRDEKGAMIYSQVFINSEFMFDELIVLVVKRLILLPSEFQYYQTSAQKNQPFSIKKMSSEEFCFSFN
ncbi:hypothetical protein VUJ46_16405 [Chryseobacterium sp. MYb264]|uniref:DUF6876 family protein n=1 Tax=Chryseobacterium sp. MYb264 TaxID=2745153 RepID=UPI002E0FBFB5|nr:DUF6876 family protein [Chryseobacterium sp. MYb264]WSO28353.1 hypothetical protein VUJ46_16405 [Chryseobacterium sp. MYb264]